MLVISVTRLQLRSWRFLPMFGYFAFRSMTEAQRAEGNLGSKVLRERRNTFWTATAWTSEAAMKNFMLAGAHGKAMRKLLNWCDEAALVHWTQETAELPTWKEAWRRLQNEGRRSKVNFSSAVHLAHQFPEPLDG